MCEAQTKLLCINRTQNLLHPIFTTDRAQSIDRYDVSKRLFFLSFLVTTTPNAEYSLVVSARSEVGYTLFLSNLRL